MKHLAWLLLTASIAWTDGPRVVYSKSFPGSRPAWSGVILNKDGSAEYREAPDEDNPIRFTLSEADTKAIFELAEKVEFFKRPLESGLNVARMGEKCFRWEDGPARNEVKFNYTQDLDGQKLQDWFERITETELHLIDLERTVRFDRLGVHKSLLELQVSWERKRLVAPDQFLKLLDRVAKNEVYLNIARERAAAMAEAIRAGTAKNGE